MSGAVARGFSAIGADTAPLVAMAAGAWTGAVGGEDLAVIPATGKAEGTTVGMGPLEERDDACSSRLGGRTIRATSVILAFRRATGPKGKRAAVVERRGLGLTFGVAVRLTDGLRIKGDSPVGADGASAIAEADETGPGGGGTGRGGTGRLPSAGANSGQAWAGAKGSALGIGAVARVTEAGGRMPAPGAAAAGTAGGDCSDFAGVEAGGTLAAADTGAESAGIEPAEGAGALAEAGAWGGEGGVGAIAGREGRSAGGRKLGRG